MQTLNNVNVSLNFNLRQPNKKTASSPIYCVVKIDRRQLKVPTGLKVYGYQWDKQRQQCAINANMVAADQANNANTNRIINAVKMAYDELFVYLCGNGDTYTATEIERLIKDVITAQTNNDNNMSNPNATPPKRTTTATTLIKKAFALYYTDNTKASTLKVNEQRLKGFCDYIKASKKGDTPKNHLSQDGLSDYRQHLIDEGKAPSTIGELCRFVARLINDVLCVHADFRKFNFSPVRFVAVKNKRKQTETKKTDLTTEEVQAIKDCKGLTAKEAEWRDLFIMQIETGVRVSDLPKLFTGDYKEKTDGETTTYLIDTQKEGITAAVIATPTIKKLQTRYKDGFRFVDLTAKAFTQSYNYFLRPICEKAGLVRVIDYTDPNGNKKAERLCDCISNHFARHTFITHKLREGYTPAEVSKMSGHADTRMIESIYQHLNDEDKANAVIAAKNRVQGKQQTSSSTDNETANAVIAEQAKENYQQRQTIASQRQMIAIEKQKQEINELLKQEENEAIKEELEIIKALIEEGNIETAQEEIKSLIKYGYPVELISEEETEYFEELSE